MIKVEVYQCPKCKQWIYSRARHDYKTCECKTLAVDGSSTHNNILVAQRIIGIINPKRKIQKINVTIKELYDDWNNKNNKYGVLK